MLCCTMLLLLMVGLRKAFLLIVGTWAGREVAQATAMPPGARRVVAPEMPVSVVFGG